MFKKLLAIATLFSATAINLAANAEPAMVIEMQSGRILHAEDEFRRWSPASLTKLMTAYVTFKEIEAGRLTLTSPVVMSPAAVSQPPSKMGYPSGSVLTVENALKMVIIRSANDVSVALGEAVSGSEQAFVARMNEEAQQLGMTHTNFANPHGLHNDGQYTTARDMAILARTIRTQFPQYSNYFQAEGIRTGQDVIKAHNLLLGRFPGANGMKTGFVCAAGFNLIASATRDNTTLISVVMGTDSPKERTEKSAELLAAGFAQQAAASDSVQTLDTLPIDAAMARIAPANLRPEICTEEARLERMEDRNDEGDIIFTSPLISEYNRDPKVFDVGLGGADGQSAVAIVFAGSVIDAYPVPQPKPDRPTLLEDGDFERYGLKPEFIAPIPRTRPQTQG